MKKARELLFEYMDEHPEEFERGEHGTLVPDGTQERILKEWLEGPQGGSWGGSLRGATKEDVCKNAEAVLMYLSGEGVMEEIAVCMDAFAEWERDETPGPEVVISYCEWMKSALQKRWREPGIFWPTAAVNLLFCELGIRSFHRLDTRGAETSLGTLILNAACLFQLGTGD
jgi:hypothetical protein